MKFNLLKPIQLDLTPSQQVMFNRGIEKDFMDHFLHPIETDLSDPAGLGEEILDKACERIHKAIEDNEYITIVVDADNDGYCSASLMANYLYALAPDWVKTNVTLINHEEKQHGLKDVYPKIIETNTTLVLVPDAGSSDLNQHVALKALGIDCIVMDHHLTEINIEESPAIIINNQTVENFNKNLCGAAITWEVCRWYDRKYNYDYSDKFVDLVAMALISDMMDIRDVEVKYLIQKGLKQVKNPFFYGLINRNAYSIGNTDNPTPIAIAFYVAPYVNAVTRTGTIEEKDLIINSMLQWKSFVKVPSTKRGHKEGDMETIQTQAIRVIHNIKNRQKKLQDEAIKKIKNIIKEQHLDEHKAIIITLPKGTIEKNLAGLVANKIAAEYKKPTCVLTDSGVDCQGSLRGCVQAGIPDFKSVCDSTGLVNYTAGHANACGIGIDRNKLTAFVQKLDSELQFVSDDNITHDVDFVYYGFDFKPEDLLDICSLEYCWGTNFQEAKVGLDRLSFSSDDVIIYDKRTTTIKIHTSNGIDLIKFNATGKDVENFTKYDQFYFYGTGRCSRNEWNGETTAQVLIEDYEIEYADLLF